jgi:glutathione S-transferase
VAAHAQKELLPPILDWLDGAIPASDHLVGDKLTLADISVASMLVNLQHLGISLDATRRPGLARYAKAMLGRPSFAGLIEKETAFLARFA